MTDDRNPDPPETDEDADILVRGWTDVRTAVGFLTILPVGRLPDNVTLARAAWAFPLAGVVAGLAAAVVLYVAAGIGLPPVVCALLGVAALAVVTGVLHEDGLGDVADGFGGGADREHKLEIMHDSRTGTFGVVAIVLSVAFRAVCLAALGGAGAAALGLIAACAFSRAGLPFLMMALDPARAGGLGAEAGRPTGRAALIALAIAAVIALVLVGWWGAVVGLAATVVVTAGLGWLARVQIGGQTGDVMGAAEQLGQVAVLLVFVAIAA